MKNLGCCRESNPGPKPFNPQIMAPLQRGGVSNRYRKGVLTAHNWWSIEYETAASSTTQQYKGKIVKVSRGLS